MADGTKFSSIVWEVNEIGSIKNESEKKKKIGRGFEVSTTLCQGEKKVYRLNHPSE